MKFAQDKLADHVHAGVAVVQARDEGKLLAAMMLENLGIFLRNFLQRFQAIGRKAGRDDGDAPHTQRGCDAQAWGVTEALRVWKLLSEV